MISPTRARFVALAALAATSLLVGACSASPAPEAEATTTVRVTEPSPDTSERRPGTTAGTAPIGDEAALLAEVERLSTFVEEQRGMPFKQEVPVHLADDKEFEDLLFATTTDEDWAEMERSVTSLEALGMVEPGTDIRATMTDMLGAGVLGFYDTEKEELVVRGADIDLLVQSTLVHELTHALDDQYFDLDRPDLDEATDESSFAFSALVEGNAMRVESAWQDTLTPEQRKQRDRAEMDMGLDQAHRLLEVPPVLLDLLTAPYTLGEPFVDDIADDGGEQAVDAAFGNSPTTSEQVMHPDAYAAGEAAVAVPAPTADAAVVDEGVLGEYGTVLVLADVVRGSQARKAAEGWGGDHYVVWRTDDGTACISLTWTMDSAAERTELDTALDAWSAERPEATVTPVDDTSVNLRTCADDPGTPSTTAPSDGAPADDEGAVASVAGTGTVGTRAVDPAPHPHLFR